MHILPSILPSFPIALIRRNYTSIKSLFIFLGDFFLNHNCKKILSSNWLLAALISAHVRLSNFGKDMQSHVL